MLQCVFLFILCIVLHFVLVHYPSRTILPLFYFAKIVYIYFFFYIIKLLCMYLLGLLASFVMFSKRIFACNLEDSMVYNTSSFRAIVIFMYIYIYFESIVGFLFMWELNIARSRKFMLLSQDLIKHHFQKP